MIQRHDLFHVLRALRWLLQQALVYVAVIAVVTLVVWLMVNFILLTAIAAIAFVSGLLFVLAWGNTRIR